MLQRIEPSIQSARVSSKEVAIVFSVGVNDSRHIVAGNVEQETIERYKQNIDSAINIFKKYTDRILIVGLTTTHPEHDDVHAKDFVYNRDRIAKYNSVLKDAAEKVDVAFVPVAHVLAGNAELFYTDNLHLSDSGHAALAANMKLEIKKLLS